MHEITPFTTSYFSRRQTRRIPREDIRTISSDSISTSNFDILYPEKLTETVYYNYSRSFAGKVLSTFSINDSD